MAFPNASQSLPADKDTEGDVEMLHEPQNGVLGKKRKFSERTVDGEGNEGPQNSDGPREFIMFEIRITCLPNDTTDADLMKIFEAYNPCRANVHIETYKWAERENLADLTGEMPDRQCSLSAWLAFHTMEDRAKAFEVSVKAGLKVELLELDLSSRHIHMNGRWIRCKMSKEDKRRQAEGNSDARVLAQPRRSARQISNKRAKILEDLKEDLESLNISQ